MPPSYSIVSITSGSGTGCRRSDPRTRTPPSAPPGPACRARTYAARPASRPGRTASPTLRSSTRPAAGSTASPGPARPAPSTIAAAPSASASMPVDDPVGRGPHGLCDRRARQPLEVLHRPRIAVLRGDHLREPAGRAAVSEPRLEQRPRGRGSLGDAGQQHHAGAERQAQLVQVVRPVAPEGPHRLRDLERVADRAAERLVHPAQHRDRAPPGAAADPDHRAGQRRGPPRASS